MHAAPPPRLTFPNRRSTRIATAVLWSVLLVASAALSARALAETAPGDTPTPRSSPLDERAAEGEGVLLAPVVVDGQNEQRDSAQTQRRFDTPEDVTGFGETILAEPAWRSFDSTAELLGRSVGAQLRRRGGREDFSTLSIRGAPAGQVRVLLDGVPLGRASDSVVNMADLPLDSVERLEVYRGFAPVGLTPASAAGVVNIVTRQPTGVSAGLAAGLGSFGSGKISSSAAAPLAGGSASAFASLRTTDGDFEYLDDNGTLFNPFDDRVRRRANNDSNAVDALLRWQRPLGEDWRVSLRNHAFYKDEGVPGLARFTPPNARLETVRDVAAASIESSDARWGIESGLTWQRAELSDHGAIDNVGRTLASTTTGRWSRELGRAHWLAGSGELAYETFQQRFSTAPASSDDADRWSLALAAGDDWTFHTLGLIASLQLRHQEVWNGFDASTPGTAGSTRSTDPRFGLRWTARPGLVVKTNVASYFRPPNFDELFGTDGFTTGNPLLRPETGVTYDAGFEATLPLGRAGNLSLGYAWFGSEIDDVILVVLTFQRTAKALNAAEARIRGHEARIEWTGPRGLALSANYTFQDAENRSPAASLRGKDLPGLPPHEAYGRASWTVGRFVLAYEVDVSGKHFIDSENVMPPLPTRVLHGLSLVHGPFWGGMRLTLEAENLGDSLVPDEIGFPLPGRAFYATLSWTLPTAGE